MTPLKNIHLNVYEMGVQLSDLRCVPQGALEMQIFGVSPFEAAVPHVAALPTGTQWRGAPTSSVYIEQTPFAGSENGNKTGRTSKKLISPFSWLRSTRFPGVMERGSNHQASFWLARGLPWIYGHWGWWKCQSNCRSPLKYTSSSCICPENKGLQSSDLS